MKEREWAMRQTLSDDFLREVLNMAIHGGIISEEQARAIMPLATQSRTDGREGPL